MDLLSKTAENLKKFDLLPASGGLLVAVSGGLDSMVLLRVLHSLTGEKNCPLQVAHFNHRLRGAVSDLDQDFVYAVAQRLDLPFHPGSGDVSGFAHTAGLSIEMAGRELRHRFLAETAQRLGCPSVALAHHADDQVETFWLRLLRGEVGAGWPGMRWKSPSFASPEIQLVRPFLNIFKTEIAAYARASGVEFREDASNADPSFLRNRLRHELLPRIQEFQPQLVSISMRTAEILLAEKEFLAASAAQWLASRQPAFEELHRALQREVLRQQILLLREQPTFDLIEELRSGERPVMIRAGYVLYRNRNGSVERSAVSTPAFLPDELRLDLVARGEVSFGGRRIGWDFASARGAPTAGTEYLDAAKVGAKVTLRHWRPGDRFRPIGGRPAKLQDLFTNLKVTPQARRERVLAVSESGEIFWVEGLRIGDAFRVQNETTQVLKWSWRRNPTSST